eukprot:6186185-Pleurochrysis_carterae.AAC.1
MNRTRLLNLKAGNSRRQGKPSRPEVCSTGKKRRHETVEVSGAVRMESEVGKQQRRLKREQGQK